MPWKDRERYLKYQREYHRKHKERYSQSQKNIRSTVEWRERERQKNKMKERRLKLKVLQMYSGDPPKCACCGESIIQFLTIDHINGRPPEQKGKNKKRFVGNRLYRWLRKNNFPPGFQVLCWNCNAAKHYFGTCPHQKPLPYP